MFSTNAKPRSYDNVFSSFRPLPKELLYEIAAHLQVKDVLSFCLVCREFHQLGLAILYKTIQNINSRCLDTLASNDRNKLAVKTLALPSQVNNQLDSGCTWLNPKQILHSSVEECTLDVKAASILPSLYNLQNLSVPPFSAIYAHPLSQCHFWNLHTLSYAMPITQPIASFLMRNSTLVNLTFDCYLPFFQNLVLRPIALPQLRYLDGNPQIMKLFVQNAPLETVYINWNYERSKGEVLDEALDLLALHCSTTLNELGVYRNTFRQCTCNNQVLVKISEKVPHITKLGLNGINISDGFIDTINSSLSHFKNLKSLDMDQHPTHAVSPPRFIGSTKLDYDQDEGIILSWASDNCCPTLRNCRLPNGILWSFRFSRLWLPSLSTVPQRKYLLKHATRWREARLQAVGLNNEDTL
ncbi:hypothetical protein F5878DRAFT_723357 [Lentinula raphanica]|uniref:F-box domain-containing protein n=1 Tax=Lentinula raphanica TaxID=153919 RepID=A0AA38PE80_9AGAR|nr:hypothetical protein C8R42DRAFT_725013 [Lentinula raphanica]KAJ3840936.1 hypothetical protein F5878DRAFT_723357 [Lentinula raphanica]